MTKSNYSKATMSADLAPTKDSSPSQKVGFLHEAFAQLLMFLWGLRDTVSIYRTLRPIVNNFEIAKLTLLTLGTNTGLLVGSVFMYSRAIRPLMGYVKDSIEDELEEHAANLPADNIIDKAAWFAYRAFWLLPICGLCYACSMAWYQELADNTYKYMKSIPKSLSISKSVGFALYMTLVWLLAFTQLQLLDVAIPALLVSCQSAAAIYFRGLEATQSSMAKNVSISAPSSPEPPFNATMMEVGAILASVLADPTSYSSVLSILRRMLPAYSHTRLVEWIVLGSFQVLISACKAAGFLFMCIMYGWYGFDHRWNARSVAPDIRFATLETHWAYFLGFGIPYALISKNTDFFLGYGCYLGLFPFCILLGSVTDYDAPYRYYDRHFRGSAVGSGKKQQGKEGELPPLRTQDITLRALRVFAPAQSVAKLALVLLDPVERKKRAARAKRENDPGSAPAVGKGISHKTDVPRTGTTTSSQQASGKEQGMETEKRVGKVMGIRQPEVHEKQTGAAASGLRPSPERHQLSRKDDSVFGNSPTSKSRTSVTKVVLKSRKDL